MHFNRSWMLTQCVAAIRQYTRHPYRLIIRDHNSEPQHQAHIKQLSGPDCEIQFHDQFYSCLDGRRKALDDIKTSRCVFLDDDIKVSPLWLTNLVARMESAGAAVVPMNLWTDLGETDKNGDSVYHYLGGIRLVQAGEVGKGPWLYTGRGDMAPGGATLYRTEYLKATKYRPEYRGGFEDWDQILQITQDLNGTVWGSKVVGFHHHRDRESMGASYWNLRWRWRETMEAALAAWDYWGIKLGVRDTWKKCIENRVTFPEPVMERIRAIRIDEIAHKITLPGL